MPDRAPASSPPALSPPICRSYPHATGRSGCRHSFRAFGPRTDRFRRLRFMTSIARLKRAEDVSNERDTAVSRRRHPWTMLLAIASVSRALAALPGERAPGALGATGGSADGALIAGARPSCSPSVRHCTRGRDRQERGSRGGGQPVRIRSDDGPIRGDATRRGAPQPGCGAPPRASRAARRRSS